MIMDQCHVYISSACNRVPQSADWGRNKLICYGACNSVALYDPKYGGVGKVISVLYHHKGRVNSVRWIKQNNNALPETELISTSSDGTAVVWTRVDECNFKTSVLKGHQNTVTIADGVYVPSKTEALGNQVLIIATASLDYTVKIWRRLENEDNFICVQTLNFGSGFCLSLCLTLLPATNIILLACATDDAKINLFSENQTSSSEISAKEEDAKLFFKVDTLIGHEDWISSMDFALDDNGNLLLATCSQDCFIRLWRIAPCDEKVVNQTKKNINQLDLTEDIKLEEKFFKVSVDGEKKLFLYFAVSLESVLAGHEGWIYGVNWHPVIYSEDKKQYIQPMKLLSSSLDKSIIIWEPDATSGVWLESVRVGEVGGNTLGFYGSKFGPDGKSIIGHGYQGSFHLWSYSEETKSWEPDVTVGGHFGEVLDMQWEPGGQFLLSVGADQTTRIHAPWVRSEKQKVTWHELARPQVHGYDMSCLAVLSRYKFASGAEEKVIRAFHAPNNFIENFHKICKVERDGDNDGNIGVSFPQGASVPALGLSNKAVYEGEEMPTEDRHVKDEYPEFYFTSLSLKEPPTEENLIQNTLWPEVHKLYGHGYELYSLAARHDGTLLASACKATTAEHAAIILWDTSTWKQSQTLVSHQLTVTQMAFSPNDEFLLSVSRDRRWTLFKLCENETHPSKYNLIATTDKKTGIHSRIIWCCAWTHDSKYFFTGSREGKVVVWGEQHEQPTTESSLGQYGNSSDILELKNESVTALGAAPIKIHDNAYLLAIGLESGSIVLYKWLSDPGQLNAWQKCQLVDNLISHHLQVNRIAFRPLQNQKSISDSSCLQLASCGSDHAVKIFNFQLNKL